MENWKLRILAILLLSALIQLGMSSGPRGNETRVYYYPMRESSYIPMTRDLIKSQYDISSLARRNLDSIRKKLAAGKPSGAKVMSDYLRLLIIEPKGESMECDLFGNVRIGRKTLKLSTQQYRELHRLILDCLPPG